MKMAIVSGVKKGLALSNVELSNNRREIDAFYFFYKIFGLSMKKI